ncbi:MAG: DUF3344 domain-containing protein [Methanophagales archaeon ANME-1-THS]|nr:MAG: DUF3344 domain-containing protein [Methanophagales archaeon ANME-1-THS]
MRSKGLCIMVIILLLVTHQLPLGSGSYAGDKPLHTVMHDELRGGVLFTLGDSRYSGQLRYNETYTVNFDLTGMGSKEVQVARLYVYWVWSQRENVGVYPTMGIGASGTTPSFVTLYTDTKGFVGRYDYFSGVTVYECHLELREAGNSYSVTITNEDVNGSTFSLQGIGLLLLYECAEHDQACPRIAYWITEGCDMIYADYGITPEMATSRIYFEGDLDLKRVKRAQLITIVPSGGYIQRGETAHNVLYFNEEIGWLTHLPFLKSLLRLLFGYGGGIWSDVYIATETLQIAIDQRDVTAYLKTSNNFAAIQDNHDYMMVTNALLVVELSEESEKK